MAADYKQNPFTLANEVQSPKTSKASSLSDSELTEVDIEL